MKIRSILYVMPLFAVLCTSCEDEATIRVTNAVHNVQLDNINFDKFGVGSYILPGESTPEVTISSKEASFPLSAQLQFYMVKGDRRVFLKTKDTYTLNADDKLTITINDDTEVVNMIND